MDRIDIHIEVPHVDYEKLAGEATAEPSSAVRARVEAARERQRKRLKGTALYANADMGPAEVREFCQLDAASKSLMKVAMVQLGLSARAYHRVLKLSRTIADLAGAEQIAAPHLAEALQYRKRQRD